MRQFFSWRIWLAFASVAGLVLLLRVALPTGVAGKPESTGPSDRTIDFVSLVYQVQPGLRFVMLDGVVNGSADVIIDGQRTMRLVQGTPGELNCPDLEEIGRCVVVADLLGDAVVWFELVPVQPGNKVKAAPIVEILDDGIMRLENGWLVRSANSIDRRCDTETASLSEFIRDHGRESTTIIDVATQKVTAVVCADADLGADESSSTSSTPATSTVASSSAETTVAATPSESIPQEG